jgi:hypothetical protein
MASNLFDSLAVQQVVSAFALSPVQNPSGYWGIALHVDVDETNLPLASWSASMWSQFRQFKTSYFGTSTERGNGHTSTKALAYRYCVFADTVQNRISGWGETPGNDFMTGLRRLRTVSPQPLQVQAGTFMHELGHTLGLKHGGRDTINHKPNYHSVMNYTWQMPLPGITSGWTPDYSRVELDSLNEHHLVDSVGVSDSRYLPIPIGPPRQNAQGRWVFRSVPPWGRADWDGVRATEFCDTCDVNRWIENNVLQPPSPGEPFAGSADWDRLLYAPRRLKSWHSPGDQPDESDSTVNELSDEDYEAMAAAMVDCNENGVPDVEDIETGGSLDDDGDGIPDECQGGGVTAVEAPVRVPERLSLLPGRPNPFTRSTTLGLELPRRAEVRVEIFDVGGRRVRRLALGTFDAGAHPLHWDGLDDAGRRVRAGVYLVRAESGGNLAHARLVLLE